MPQGRLWMQYKIVGDYQKVVTGDNIHEGNFCWRDGLYDMLEI